MKKIAWQRVGVPTVAFFQEGPGLRNWQWTDSGMKVINGTNIRDDGRFDPSNTTRAISLEEFKAKYRHFAIDANDIVVASSGTLGKAARVKAEHLPMMMNTSVIRFRANDRARLDDGFLFAWLRSRDFLDQALGMATGAAQQNFGPSHVKQMTLPLPAIAEQRRIASILSAYDDLIENNTRRIAILEEMGRRTCEEWFVRFRFPGHKGVRMVESELGLVPDGWAIRAFDEIAMFTNGFAFKPEHLGTEGAPIVKIKELKAGVQADTPRFNGSLPDRYRIKHGDLLFSWSADLDVYVWGNEEGWLNQHLFLVAALEPATPGSYLFHALKTAMPSFRTRSNGATMKHIKRSALSEVKTAVPPVQVAVAFDQAVGPLHELVKVLSRKNRNLRTTRDLLLPKLISGELDVSALPEPEALAA